MSLTCHWAVDLPAQCKPLLESTTNCYQLNDMASPYRIWQCLSLNLLFQNYDKFKISSQHAGHLEIIIIWKKPFRQSLMMLPWPWWLHMLCHLQNFSVPKNAQDLLPGLNLLFHNYDKSEISSQHAGRWAIFIIGKSNCTEATAQSLSLQDLTMPVIEFAFSKLW